MTRCNSFSSPVPWFHGKIPREEAEALLAAGGMKDGMFLLRESTNYPGDYTLCVAVDKTVQHYRVERLESGLMTVDNESFFDSLTQLVEHYREDADGLCTRLLYPVIKRTAQPAIDRNVFKKCTPRLIAGVALGPRTSMLMCARSPHRLWRSRLGNRARGSDPVRGPR